MVIWMLMENIPVDIELGGVFQCSRVPAFQCSSVPNYSPHHSSCKIWFREDVTSRLHGRIKIWPPAARPNNCLSQKFYCRQRPWEQCFVTTMEHWRCNMCDGGDGVWWSGALQLSRFPHSRAGPWPPTRHTGDIEMELYSCNHFIYSLPSFYQDFL